MVLITWKGTSTTVGKHCVFFYLWSGPEAWEVMVQTWNSRGCSRLQHLLVFWIIPDPEMGFRCYVTLWCSTFGYLLSVISWWVWLVSYTGKCAKWTCWKCTLPWQRQNISIDILCHNWEISLTFWRLVCNIKTHTHTHTRWFCYTCKDSSLT